MLVSLSVGKGLDKNIIDSIKNRSFSNEQLQQIYNGIISEQGNATSSLIGDAVVLLIAFIFIVYEMTVGFTDMYLLGILIMLGCFVICLLMLYYSLFAMRRKQFIKAVNKAYLELKGYF